MLKPLENSTEWGIHQQFLENALAERIYNVARSYVTMMAVKGRHKKLCFYVRYFQCTRVREAGICYLYRKKGVAQIQLLRLFSFNYNCSKTAFDLFEDLVGKMGFHLCDPDPRD